MMEWDNNHQQQPNNHNSSNLQGIDVSGGGSSSGGMYVKVMTDEQLETLRKQIAIYATICERLVEMHKTLTSQQDLAGLFSLPFLCSYRIEKSFLFFFAVILFYFSEFWFGLIDSSVW